MYHFPLFLAQNFDSVGWTEENQRVLLVLGRHVSLHQHPAPVASRRAKRCWILWLFSRAFPARTEGGNVYQRSQRQRLREAG